MKELHKSKTFWLNLLAGIVATATYVDSELLSVFAFSNDDQMKILKITGIVVSLGNVYLRMITKEPIKKYAPKDKKRA